MKVHDLMTPDARAVRPDDTLVDAACVMRDMNIGSVPVCDQRRLTGFLTDRDIAVRAVADGRDPKQTRVRDAMSEGIIYVFDDDADAAARMMEQHQIRRLPVVDRQKQLVGVVSLGDLSVRGIGDRRAGETLRDVSEPSQPSR